MWRASYARVLLCDDVEDVCKIETLPFDMVPVHVRHIAVRVVLIQTQQQWIVAYLPRRLDTRPDGPEFCERSDNNNRVYICVWVGEPALYVLNVTDIVCLP